MLSPRSSMGGESPLKPPSVEASPPQQKEQEQQEETESEAAEPQKGEDTGRILTVKFKLNYTNNSYEKWLHLYVLLSKVLYT